jgi:hypothetical protein
MNEHRFSRPFTNSGRAIYFPDPFCQGAILLYVGIRALQRVHAATHPAEARNVTQAARTAVEREGLLAALAADEEEGEEPVS